MWSLPDIKRMNAEASSQKSKLQKAVRTGKLDGKPLQCEWADHDSPSQCEGELRHYLWHDIFGPDPKGILTLCEHHDGYYGSPSEGYFTCGDCGEVFAENYTWELYYHVGDGDIYCLPCYAAQVIADEERWIPLTDEAIKRISFNDVRKAPHCIGVEMPVPKEIKFVNNVEFDSMDGHCISGGGVEELKDTLRDLQTQGVPRALLILDAAYQFAVSIGVYAPNE
jgi:hypothetical protein